MYTDGTNRKVYEEYEEEEEDNDYDPEEEEEKAVEEYRKRAEE
jgi:hypothetical protein